MSLLTGLVSRLVVIGVIDDQATSQKNVVFQRKAIEKRNHWLNIGDCALLDIGWSGRGRSVVLVRGGKASLAKRPEEHHVFAAKQLGVVVLEDLVNRLLDRLRRHLCQNPVITNIRNLGLSKTLPTRLSDQ